MEKTKELGEEFKPINIDIGQEQKDLLNQYYINDLSKILKTNSTVPTHIPRKFIDCIYLYNNGATYELYLYINNSWKKVTLS